MEQTPHYPTSAELAAFRRSIREQWFAKVGPERTIRNHPLGVSLHGTIATWPEERRDGIGYPTRLIDVRADQSNMRREASAMRSRVPA